MLYITASPAKVADVQLIKRWRALCQDAEDVLILLDQVTKKELLPLGGNQYAEGVTCNTLSSPQDRGNSREYTIARLERDGFHDLALQVIERKVTAAKVARVQFVKTIRLRRGGRSVGQHLIQQPLQVI